MATPLSQQSADVRFREIDLSQVIRSNSTSNAALVVVSKKGRPGNYYTTNSKEFTDEYGTPNAAISFAHYTAVDFFQEGSSLWVRRALGSDYFWSSLILKDDGIGNTSLFQPTAGIRDPEQIEWNDYISGAQQAIGAFYPKSGPGSYGDDYAIAIRSENIEPPNPPVLSSSNTGGVLTQGTYVYQISALSELGETLVSQSAQLVLGGPANTASIRVRWDPVDGARGYNVYGRVGGNVFLLETVGATTYEYLDTGLTTPDVDHPPITNPVNLSPAARTFTVEIYDMSVNSSSPQESFLCSLTEYVDGNGVQLEIEQQINAYSDYVSFKSNVPQLMVDPPIVKSVPVTRLVRGDSGTAPTNGQIARAWIDGFQDPEQVNINLMINGGYTDIMVQRTMSAVAEKRGDAIAILDLPAISQKAQDAITYRQLRLNLNTSYAVLCGQDVETMDLYNNKTLFTPQSGWFAAACARTDRVAGPQFSPAGLNRGQLNVVSLRHNYNEQERTNLFLAQVNYARNIAGNGISIFEAVTLQAKQSALSWVPVRRMVNVIKKSVREFLMYSLHEPNDDFTRRAIVSSVSDYLLAWKNARGLLAYSVISDDTNNPNYLYNLGILKVTIFITPIIPVHEIQVDLVITKAGMSFSEINIQSLG